MESVREILKGEKMEVLIQLNHDLALLRLLLDDLLRFVSRRGICQHCGAGIFWVHSAHTSDVVPYNRDGSLHHATCSGKFSEEEPHE